MYLLDTNVCIDFALGRSERLRDNIKAAFARGVSISSITLAELRVGAQHSDAEDDHRLDDLIRILMLRDFDQSAAEAYGRIARQVGVSRRSFDRLIAAHALSLGLTLVTRNTKDFEGVPGLKVVNWTI